MDVLNISNERKGLQFTINGESEYTLPLMGSLPASYVKRFAEVARLKDEEEQQNAFMQLQFEILERYCPGLTEEATVEDLREILEAWRGDEAGES